MPEHGQQLELLDGIGADGRGEPQQPLAAVLAEEVEAVDFDQADLGVDEPLAVVASDCDVVPRPQCGEFGGAGEQLVDEQACLGIARVAAGDRRAQVRSRAHWCAPPRVEGTFEMAVAHAEIWQQTPKCLL